MNTQPHSPQIELWLKLIRADGVGPTMFKRLLDYFGEVELVFKASISQLMKIEGIGSRTAENIVRTRNDFDAANAIVRGGTAVYVAGYVNNDGTDDDFTVRAYRQRTGELLWQTRKRSLT